MNFLATSDRNILAALNAFKRTAQAATIAIVIIIVFAQLIRYTAHEAYESGCIVRRWFDKGGAEKIAYAIALPIALGVIARRRFDQHHVADVALTVDAVVWMVAGAVKDAAARVAVGFAAEYFVVGVEGPAIV